jgi:hypothetical protein
VLFLLPGDQTIPLTTPVGLGNGLSRLFGELRGMSEKPTLEDYRRLQREYAEWAENTRSYVANAAMVVFSIFLHDYQGLKMFLPIAKAIVEEEREVWGERPHQPIVDED